MEGLARVSKHAEKTTTSSDRGGTIGALRAERQILTSANGTSCSARHELRSCAFLFIYLFIYCFCGVRATHKCLAFLQFLREFWPMRPPLMIHSALALFAQRTRIPTSARSIGFCVIWFVLVRVRVRYCIVQGCFFVFGEY